METIRQRLPGVAVDGGTRGGYDGSGRGACWTAVAEFHHYACSWSAMHSRAVLFWPV